MKQPAAAALVILICALGSSLRAWNLDRQVIEDDELHAIVASVRHDAAYLATHHEPNDYSIPLALWDRLLIDGPGLDERGLRAPMLAAGILFLVVFALFVWREIGALEAILAAGLAAASPLLILYSRFARPYMLVVLLAFLCFVGRYQWAKTGRRRWALLSAVAGALAMLCNVLSAPTIACIWSFELLRRRRGSLWLVAAGAAATLLVLGPSARSLIEMARTKAGVERPSLAILWRVAQLFAGSRVTLVVSWLFASAVIGAARLWTRRRDEVLLFAAMLTVQVAAIVVLAPGGTSQVLVTARYLMPPLSGFLILVAAGLAAQIEAVARRTAPVLSTAFAALLLVAIVRAGWLDTIFWRPNAFTSHAEYYEGNSRAVDLSRASIFYSFLASEGDDTAVVETPRADWGACHYQEYQRLHRHRVTTAVVVTAYVASLPDLDRVHAQTIRLVFEQKPALSPNEFLIVHHDLIGEQAFLTHHPIRNTTARFIAWRQEYVDAAAALIPRLSPYFPIAFSDDQIVVFAGSEQARARAARWLDAHPPAASPQ